MIQEFFTTIDIEYLTRGTWLSISKIFLEKDSKIENKKRYKSDMKEKKSVTEIAFSSNNLRGIFNYLKSNSNINDEFEDTRSSIYNSANLDLLLDIESTKDNWFSTTSMENSWISFEFKKHKINPSHYTIRSIHVSSNDRHTKNWAIEGSSDGKDWVKLDEQSNCLYLNGSNLVHTFQIQKQKENESNNYFKYLRIRQTGPNCLGDYKLFICSIEFYGEII